MLKTGLLLLFAIILELNDQRCSKFSKIRDSQFYSSITMILEHRVFHVSRKILHEFCQPEDANPFDFPVDDY